MWRQLPHSTGEERARILLELAQQAIYRDSGEEALALAEEARAIYRKMGATAPNVEVAQAIAGVGSALKQLHREKEAAELLEEAITLEREGGFEFVTDTLRTQGFYFCEAGEFERGIKSLLEAARIDEIHGNDEFLAIDFYNAARAFFDSSKYGEAIDTFTAARGLFRKLKDIPSVSRADRYLAECHIKLNQPELALVHAGKALDVATIRHDAEIECKASLALAKANMALGYLEKVSGPLSTAEYIASSSNDWNLILEIQEEYRLFAVHENRFKDADEIAGRIATIREILE